MSEFVNIEEVKRRVDIVSVAERYTKLKKNRGPCPFCGEKGSFVATGTNPAGQLINLFHCFKCNEGGNVVQLVMRLEKLEARDAALRLQAWYPSAVVTPETPVKRKFFEEVDIWLNELLVLQPGESKEGYLERVKKSVKQRIMESYQNGKKAK